MDAEDWERLPDRLGLDPARETERRELAGEVRRAVDEHLTPRQRQVFVALVLNGVPMDALVTELGSTRNAIYKTMFDARRKLRAALAAKGYLNDQTSRHS
jgi:RNA polymerase sigma-70 factor (ECF subfamily)